jgi:hypothetical protein
MLKHDGETKEESFRSRIFQSVNDNNGPRTVLSDVQNSRIGCARYSIQRKRHHYCTSPSLSFRFKHTAQAPLFSLCTPTTAVQYSVSSLTVDRLSRRENGVATVYTSTLGVATADPSGWRQRHRAFVFSQT